MTDELEWGLANGSGAYAVLNACRALFWAEEGRVVSKVAGGEWALGRLPEWRVVIEAALRDQASASGAQRKPAGAERELVEYVVPRVAALR